jgi:uncharacterized protein
VVLFNTLTKGVVELDRETYRQVKSGEAGVEIINELEKLLFLTGDEEAATLGHWDKMNRFNNDIEVTLLMTRSCNLECTYCYEKDKQELVYDKDFSKRYRYISELVSSNSPKTVSIEFFGGEPLLKKKELLDFAQKLHKLSKANEFDLNMSVMTNGTIEMKKLVQKLIPLGLRRVQVTVDGPKEVHDASRPLKGGASSFDRIMENITTLADLKVGVTLRVNVLNQSLAELNVLMDELELRGLKGRVSVYFTPIISDVSCAGSKNQIGADVSRKIVEITKKMIAREFKPGNSYYAIYPCHFFKDNSFVIDTNGDLYKCLALDRYPVGNVEKNLSSKHIMAVEQYFIGCRDCNLYPICGGGCRYKAFLKDGSIDKIYCEKKFLTEINKVLVMAKKSK